MDENIGVSYWIDAADAYAISNQACILYRIIINTGADGTVDIYDDPAANTAANLVASIPANATGVFDYNMCLPNGLLVENGHDDHDITVVYRKINP